MNVVKHFRLGKLYIGGFFVQWNVPIISYETKERTGKVFRQFGILWPYQKPNRPTGYLLYNRPK